MSSLSEPGGVAGDLAGEEVGGQVDQGVGMVTAVREGEQDCGNFPPSTYT